MLSLSPHTGRAPQRAFLPLAAALQMRWGAFACISLARYIYPPCGIRGWPIHLAAALSLQTLNANKAVEPSAPPCPLQPLFFLLDMASGQPRPVLNVEDQEDFSRPFAAVIEKQGQCDFQIRPAFDGTPHLYAMPAAESRATVGWPCCKRSSLSE